MTESDLKRLDKIREIFQDHCLEGGKLCYGCFLLRIIDELLAERVQIASNAEVILAHVAKVEKKLADSDVRWDKLKEYLKRQADSCVKSGDVKRYADLGFYCSYEQMQKLEKFDVSNDTPQLTMCAKDGCFKIRLQSEMRGDDYGHFLCPDCYEEFVEQNT